MPSSRGSSQPRDRTSSSYIILHYLHLLHLAGEFFTTSTTWERQNLLEIYPYQYPLEIQQIFSNWNIALFNS